jgi:hypothetical protein
MSDSAVTYLRAAAEILAMPGGPSRDSARAAIKLARLAADQIEARLGEHAEIDLGALVGMTLAAIKQAPPYGGDCHGRTARRLTPGKKEP